mmetsp:Transcript_12434/g.43916  ORF Transcript_12434/g.43916 Transcript_12434/m.43916 type:complete len:215 (-) Transcript_12434:960-1604(-)
MTSASEMASSTRRRRGPRQSRARPSSDGPQTSAQAETTRPGPSLRKAALTPSGRGPCQRKAFEKSLRCCLRIAASLACSSCAASEAALSRRISASTSSCPAPRRRSASSPARRRRAASRSRVTGVKSPPASMYSLTNRSLGSELPSLTRSASTISTAARNASSKARPALECSSKSCLILTIMMCQSMASETSSEDPVQILRFSKQIHARAPPRS